MNLYGKRYTILYRFILFYMFKWRVKKYLFHANICHLAFDHILCMRKVEEYASVCNDYDNSKEYILMKNILECYKNYDKDKFSEYIKEHDKISAFDAIYIKILLVIKQNMEDPEEEELI